MVRDNELHIKRPCVDIIRVPKYSRTMRRSIAEALNRIGARRKCLNKRVLIKPNLIEVLHHRPVNTDVRLIHAVAASFHALGAAEVVVGEGAGNCRDAGHLLQKSGLGSILDAAKIPFVDLNYDCPIIVKNRGTRTGLSYIAVPSSWRRADIIVSLAKMKTHHWAGVTLTMKNCLGFMPGVVYGWPKSLFHQRGIPESIVDISKTVKPDYAIVDGVIGMEGDGPVMGDAKASQVIILGDNCVAVDSIAARCMYIRPTKIDYLRMAVEDGLGPIDVNMISQTGIPASQARTDFQVLAHLRHIKTPLGVVLERNELDEQ